MTYQPPPPCPTCGGRGYARTFVLRHGRAIITSIPAWQGRKRHRRVVPDVKPIRVPRKLYKIKHQGTGFPSRSQTYAICSDPFHDYQPPKPPPTPRGRIGDNSDIRTAKARLSRALQGKARR